MDWEVGPVQCAEALMEVWHISTPVTGGQYLVQRRAIIRRELYICVVYLARCERVEDPMYGSKQRLVNLLSDLKQLTLKLYPHFSGTVPVMHDWRGHGVHSEERWPVVPRPRHDAF